MWLRYTKGYGFTVKDIDSSCPADLEPYAKAYAQDMKQRDREMWMWWGNYGLQATAVAIDHCLNGDKAKSSYTEKPVLDKISQENDSKYKESNEQVAVYEMKQRINELRKMGLPESPD